MARKIDIGHFDWENESEYIIIDDHEEWNKFIATLDRNKFIPFEATYGLRTNRSFWIDNRWSIIIQGECPTVYLGINMQKKQIVKFAPDSHKGGLAARKVLVNKMHETNGKKLQARFGALSQDRELYWLEWTNLDVVKALHQINRCVGPFIGSIDKNTYVSEGLYKADVSSAYPSCGRERLPDLKKSKMVRGYVEPSEEWPIVFYLVGHHIAEYGVFDTHKDMKHDLYQLYRNSHTCKMWKTKKKKEKAVSFGPGYLSQELKDLEVCLCCKYSKYDLKEFDYFYNLKESLEDGSERDEAKGVMNYSIGTFDMINCPNYEILPYKMKYFGHLRALICARHNHNMIEYYDDLIKSGYRIIQVQTDSIIWQGKMASCVSREKTFGALHLEIENGHGYIHGCGAYWVEDDNRVIEKHQGIRNWDLNKDKIQSLDDFRRFFETNEIEFEHWELQPDFTFRLA